MSKNNCTSRETKFFSAHAMKYRGRRYVVSVTLSLVPDWTWRIKFTPWSPVEEGNSDFVTLLSIELDTVRYNHTRHSSVIDTSESCEREFRSHYRILPIEDTRGTPPGEDFNDTLSKALDRHDMSWHEQTSVTTVWSLNWTGKIPRACVKDVKMLYAEHVRMEKYWFLTVLSTKGEYSQHKSL
jgi:hypothetical protein